MDPITTVQTALEAIERAYLEVSQKLGSNKNIGSYLGLPSGDIEKYIKMRLLIKGKINSRSGLYWNADEDAQLVEEIHSGINVTTIANKHSRSKFAIQKRCELLKEQGKIS